MKNAMPMDSWEESFAKICQDKLDEEPLYEYIHLYKKGLSPQQAFVAYIKENPDYHEKVVEVLEEEKKKAIAAVAVLSPEERAKKEALDKIREEAKKRLSRYCPNCAREMGSKKLCKCGYKRQKGEGLL